MANLRQLITNFYQTRFYETYDVAGNNLCRPALDALKEALPPEKYFGYKQLDQATQTLIALISEEEPRDAEPEDEEFLSHYEKLADNPQIPPVYRTAMYDLLLTGHDKYIHSNKQYLELLRKKIKLIDKGDNDTLRRVSFQAAQHTRGVSITLKKSLYEQICRKITDTRNFPFMEPLEELKKAEKEQIKQQKIQEARRSYAQLEEKLNTKDISTEERIRLLMQQEAILNDCKFSRSSTFDAKAEIFGHLQELHFDSLDHEAVEYYGLEKKRYQHLARTARKYYRAKISANYTGKSR